MEHLKARSVKSALDIPEGAGDVAWFCVTESVEKKTKNGKSFLRLKILDKNSKMGTMRVWGMKTPVLPYTIWLAEVKHDNWGYSATGWKMKQLDA